MNPIPEEILASLTVECSPFGLVLRRPSGAKIYTYTDKPVPKKSKDLARCHMMNRALHGVIFRYLRNPKPGSPFSTVHRILSNIEQKPKTAV
jgi:hypothetical protein